MVLNVASPRENLGSKESFYKLINQLSTPLDLSTLSDTEKIELRGEIWRESLMKEMTDQDVEEVAYEIGTHLNDGKVLALVNGYTAWKLTLGDGKHPGILGPALNKHVKNIEFRLLAHEDKYRGEVRKILTPAEAVAVPNTRYVLNIVYSAESGHTHNGSLAFSLSNIGTFDAEKVYSLVGLAYQGCSQLPVATVYPVYYGEPEFFRFTAPNAHKKLAKKIKFLGSFTPDRNFKKSLSRYSPKLTLRYAGYLSELLYKASRGNRGVPTASVWFIQKSIRDSIW